MVNGYDLCGLSADQPGSEKQVSFLDILLLDHVSQLKKDCIPDLFQGLVDRGQGGGDEGGEVVIVEAHDGDIPGNAQARFADGAAHAQGDVIALAEYAVRSRIEAQQLGGDIADCNHNHITTIHYSPRVGKRQYECVKHGL